jgi:RimJ/RimL family protein N-acetyltransferase
MSGFPPNDWDAFMAHWSEVLADVVSFEQDGERKVGYGIGGVLGKGRHTEALSRFLSHAEVCRPLYARVAEHNADSMRLLKKCGFASGGQEEGEYVLRLPAG